MAKEIWYDIKTDTFGLFCTIRGPQVVHLPKDEMVIWLGEFFPTSTIDWDGKLDEIKRPEIEKERVEAIA